MECILQLHSVSEVGTDAKASRGTDFMKMVHVEQMVTKIQAKVRGVLTMKRLERELEE